MKAENVLPVRTLAKPSRQMAPTATAQKSEAKDTVDIDTVWSRIENMACQTFWQIRGGEFTYIVRGNALYPNRTNVQISKAHFKKALEYFPLSNTTKIQHLRGPSYIFAILMDRRIANG
jgi:hypothetical protein